MGTTKEKLDYLEETKEKLAQGLTAKGVTPAATFRAMAEQVGQIPGGTPLPPLTNPGTAADLLSGKQLIDGTGNVVAGNMANRGSVTQNLNAGSSFTIPQGYHSGSGKVTANSLTNQTPGTAVAADIASGKTAWVAGNKITGTASSAVTPIETGSLTIETGYSIDMTYSYTAQRADGTLYTSSAKLATGAPPTRTITSLPGTLLYLYFRPKISEYSISVSGLSPMTYSPGDGAMAYKIDSKTAKITIS